MRENASDDCAERICRVVVSWQGFGHHCNLGVGLVGLELEHDIGRQVVQNGVAAIKVVHEAIRARHRLERIVRRCFGCRDAHGLFAAGGLIVEVEGERVVAIVILLQLESVADAFVTFWVSVVVRGNPIEQLVLVGEILHLPGRQLCVTILFSTLQECICCVRIFNLQLGELIDVGGHHVLRGVIFSNNGDDGHTDLGHLEAVNFQAVRRYEVQRARKIVSNLIGVCRCSCFVFVDRVATILKEALHIILNRSKVRHNVPGAVGVVYWFSCLVFPGPGRAWKSGLANLGELGERCNLDVGDAPQNDHEVHDGSGAANFKERALGLPFPIDKVFSHERLPLAHS